jgi:hypothetical protein
MGISYENLDEATRAFMVQESRDGTHYLSPRLTPEGLARWAMLFEEAIRYHDDDWLAEQLEGRGLLRAQVRRRTRGGGYTLVDVPRNAAQLLAEGEFNRYYLRGLCLRAQAEGIGQLEVYRGKPVERPRPESEAMIGRRIDVAALLADLRRSAFVEEGLGVPGAPNSGLTARLPAPRRAARRGSG